MTEQKTKQVSVQKKRYKIASGKKGKLRVQKSMRIFRVSRLANLASKREQQPLESPVQEISIMTPTSSMSSLTQESTKYKKHGASFDDFIEDNKDWNI